MICRGAAALDLKPGRGELRIICGTILPSDYDLDHPMPENEATAEAAIRQAESIIDTLDEFARDRGRYSAEITAMRNESAGRDQQRSLRRTAT